MSETFRILVINPGSTSTKLGLFENEELVAEKKLNHSAEDIARFPHIMDQDGFRRAAMDDFLKEMKLEPKDLAAVVGRGGLLKPLAGGTYKVNEDIIADLKSSKYGEHASNLGALLAYSYTKEFGVPSFIVDPVIVDELQEEARYSGLKEIPRRSVWHALNITAVVRQTCTNLGMEVSKENFAHRSRGHKQEYAFQKHGRYQQPSDQCAPGQQFRKFFDEVQYRLNFPAPTFQSVRNYLQWKYGSHKRE